MVKLMEYYRGTVFSSWVNTSETLSLTSIFYTLSVYDWTHSLPIALHSSIYICSHPLPIWSSHSLHTVDTHWDCDTSLLSSAATIAYNQRRRFGKNIHLLFMSDYKKLRLLTAGLFSSGLENYRNRSVVWWFL